MNKIAIINSENLEIISSIKSHFENSSFELKIIEDNYETIENDDLVVLTGFETKMPENMRDINNMILNVFPSLLPAFNTNSPIKDTFTSGVKVGGITIHTAEKNNFSGKILAQYPVLIGLTTHYNEYIEELKAVTRKIYPQVIDAALNDKVFDFSDLFNPGCRTCSGNCKHCNH